jgi:hypothetical protein
MDYQQKMDWTNHSPIIPFYYLFSYWMFTWFALFCLIPLHDTYKIYLNPAVAFVVGLFENLFTFILILLYNPKWSVIWKYIVMMLTMKALPLYYILKTPVNWLYSGIAFICVFAVYLEYLYWNKVDFVNTYIETIVSVIKDKNTTPMYAFLHRNSIFT